MTAYRFGRITPVQGYMLWLLGYVLSKNHSSRDIPDGERLALMRRGRAALVRYSGKDHGYDAAAWHHHLTRNADPGYLHPYGYAGVHSAVQEAAQDRRRTALVEMLKHEDGQ